MFSEFPLNSVYATALPWVRNQTKQTFQNSSVQRPKRQNLIRACKTCQLISPNGLQRPVLNSFRIICPLGLQNPIQSYIYIYIYHQSSSLTVLQMPEQFQKTCKGENSLHLLERSVCSDSKSCFLFVDPNTSSTVTAVELFIRVCS